MPNDELPDSYRQLGPVGLKALLDSGGVVPRFNQAVIRYLAEEDQKSRLRNDASQAEQAEIASRAAAAAERAAKAAERQARAAEKANTRATIALIIAAISVLISTLGIWLGIKHPFG